MPTVAVAGGSGKLGRPLVEALVADGRYKVIILSRKAGTEAQEKELGARILAASYDSIDALTDLLTTNNVEIIVSVLDGQTGIEPELNLVQAAERSPVTKRFIPNDWGVTYTEQLATYFPIAASKKKIIDSLATTSLEHTAIHNGIFFDYWVVPKVKSYFGPLHLMIDIPNAVAALPASGDVPLVFTHTFDIARFIPALLALPRWENDYYVIGDKVTWNELLRLVEEVRGVKFDVTYDPLEKLEAGQVTELPSQKSLYPFFPKEQYQGFAAMFGKMSEYGAIDLKPKPSESLNQLFPEIKVRTVKEMLTEAWKQ